MKRLLDIIICFIASLLLAPVWLILPLLIVIDSSGTPFYIQKRVGKDNKDFNLLKFRTMYAGTDKKADHFRVSSGHAVLVLTQNTQVHIIAAEEGQAQLVFHGLFDIVVAPRQVRCE